MNEILMNKSGYMQFQETKMLEKNSPDKQSIVQKQQKNLTQ